MTAAIDKQITNTLTASQEIEAIKARVKEMEEEAEKLKEMQGEVEKQMMTAKSGQSPELHKYMCIVCVDA